MSRAGGFSGLSRKNSKKDVKFMIKEQLVSMAIEAMMNAYSPYSGYKVGAALLCKDGSVY